MHSCLHGSFFVLASFNASAAQDQAPAQQEPLSLGEIARRYQQQKAAQAGAQSPQTTVRPRTASILSDEEWQYKTYIAQLVAQQNFVELEKAADETRRTKARLAGGVWKLYIFYDAFTRPVIAGAATTSDWNRLFATLKAWMASRPDSITAPVALARAYLGYGEEARGAGLADTVSQEGWRLEAERTQQAKVVLEQAAKLKGRCPYWYEAIQAVALYQGWEKAQARALLDEAVAFEPDYYHYYREYANFLLPKWYGDEGDAEQFANEIAGQRTGEKEAFVYFEVASVINCQCGLDEVHMAHLSWARIKQGYAVLQQRYGSSNLKDNRFLYMAFLAKDRPAAQQALTGIGDSWNPYTWHNQQSFEMVRAWALNQ